MKEEKNDFKLLIDLLGYKNNKIIYFKYKNMTFSGLSKKLPKTDTLNPLLTRLNPYVFI